MARLLLSLETVLNFKYLKLCFWMLLIINLTGFNAKEKDASVSRDGLKLSVFLKRDTEEKNIVICEVRNEKTNSVAYDRNSSPEGLSFQLKDLAGNIIDPFSDWRFLSGPSALSAHIPEKIPVGGRLNYSFNIEEAFGKAAQSGGVLQVEWSPGTDPRGDPLTVGTGLSTSIIIPKKIDKIPGGSTPPQGTMPSEINNPSTAAANPQLTLPHPLDGIQAKGFRSSFWIWIIGFLVLIFIAMRLRKNKR